jgi:predicted RNase H-like nuclease (RuvC/YqgF family)
VSESEGRIIERLTRENVLLQSQVDELKRKLARAGKECDEKLEAQIKLILENDGKISRLQARIMELERRAQDANEEVERLTGLLRGRFEKR